MSPFGPRLPSSASTPNGSYLGHTGHGDNVVATAAIAPELTLAVGHQALVYVNIKKPAYSRQNGLRSSSSTS